MNEKLLRWLIYITGIICLYAFIAVRSLPVLSLILNEKMDLETKDFSRYGDLYYFGCIKHFREDYPEPVKKYRYTDEHPSIHESSILTFGDSFFDMFFQKTLPHRLAESTGEKVFSYIAIDPWMANPFCTLSETGYEKQDSLVPLIFETVERNIPLKFTDEYFVSCPEKEGLDDNKIDKFIRKYIFKSSSEQLYDLLLKRSVLTHRFYSSTSTWKYDIYGYMTTMTEKHLLADKPWLFYYISTDDKPGGFYYEYMQEEIDTYCDNMAKLAGNLRSEYNLDFIFMPIPNKYTVYHSLINDDNYNDFLPMIYEGLDKRGVKYIDLYNPFMNSSDTLYYGTDTHWNKKGVDLALDITLKKLNIPDNNLTN